MGKLFEQILAVIIRSATTLYGIAAVIVSVFETISEKVLGVTALVVETLSQSGAMFEGIAFTDYAGYLSFANSIIPIQEAWTLLVFMIPYMGVIVVYRFVKSWIPTIAN